MREPNSGRRVTDDVYLCPECQDRWMTTPDDDRCGACAGAARDLGWLDVDDTRIKDGEA